MEIKNDIKQNEFNINNLAFAPRDTDDRNRTSPFAYTEENLNLECLVQCKVLRTVILF